MLGIWSGNGSFGNIIGAALVAIMFEIFHRTLAWKLALVAVGLLIALYGLLIHFLLVPDPRDAPYQHESLEDAKPETPAVKGDAAVKQKALEADKTPTELTEGSSPKGISFFAAWCIPGVRLQSFLGNSTSLSHLVWDLVGPPILAFVRVLEIGQLCTLLLAAILFDRGAGYEQPGSRHIFCMKQLSLVMRPC